MCVISLINLHVKNIDFQQWMTGFTGLPILTMPRNDPIVGEKHRIQDPGTIQNTQHPMLRPPFSPSTRRV